MTSRDSVKAIIASVLLAMVAGACAASAPPSASPSPTASASHSAPSTPSTPSPTASRSTTASDLIPVPADYRLEGPWEVVYVASGLDTIREVFVMNPRCASGPCDVDVVIQDFSGSRLGTGVFRFEDGVYRFEASDDEVVTCAVADKEMKSGATRSSDTNLVIAGYRPSGTAVVSVRVKGTRQVATTPRDGSGCAEKVATFEASGEPTRFAAAPPTPRPTPKPAKRPNVKTIKASYFGSGVTIETYRVTGSSPYDISRSISREGPYADWIDGPAAGLTKSKPSYRFHFQSDGAGGCEIVTEKRPAIRITYTIVLPRWTATDASPASTIDWWNAHLSDIAKHEKRHVQIYRAAVKKLNSVLASSTCSNAEKRLGRVWAQVNRDQCEFDMKEYGQDAGLSLKACLAR